MLEKDIENFRYTFQFMHSAPNQAYNLVNKYIFSLGGKGLAEVEIFDPFGSIISDSV